MVPPDSFSTSAPHSSSAFCKGCDGGTQCDSFSSKVFSCASAAPEPIIAATAAAQTEIVKRAFMIAFLPLRMLSRATNYFRYSAGYDAGCKEDRLRSNYLAAASRDPRVPGRGRPRWQ